MLPILPMPPTASRVAVGREGQRADAADRVPALDRVPGVQDRRLERRRAGCPIDVPDDDVADLVAGRDRRPSGEIAQAKSIEGK